MKVAQALDPHPPNLLKLGTEVMFQKTIDFYYPKDDNKRQGVITTHSHLRCGIIIGATYRCEGKFSKGYWDEGNSFTTTKRILVYQIRTGIKSKIIEVLPRDIIQ